MKKVSVAAYLEKIEEIYQESPEYQTGGDGSGGKCDCIGLIIGAIRRAGGEWRGMHGSNYAARNEMRELRKIQSAEDLIPGEVVYKAYEPNQGGYKLPDRYNSSGDKRDYYHIGVVLSSSPLRIRHMTTPKPRLDTALGKWSYHGRLKKIDYSNESEGQILDRIVISGGDITAPIHMRQSPDTKAKIVADIPQGSDAVLLESGGAWNQVAWSGQSGYVMAKFVHKAADSSGETITVSRAELERAYDILGDLLGLRG